MRRLIDVLNEYYHPMTEDQESVAAELTPRRGMTDGHVKLVDDAVRKMGIGRMEKSKTPGRVLFVPEPAAGYDDIEHRVQDLFDRLHGLLKLDPFNREGWSIKAVV
jgi:hypothetical protein